MQGEHALVRRVADAFRDDPSVVVPRNRHRKRSTRRTALTAVVLTDLAAHTILPDVNYELPPCCLTNGCYQARQCVGEK